MRRATPPQLRAPFGFDGARLSCEMGFPPSRAFSPAARSMARASAQFSKMTQQTGATPQGVRPRRFDRLDQWVARDSSTKSVRKITSASGGIRAQRLGAT